MEGRESRALVIAATSRIEQNGAGWYVPSQSGNGRYHVQSDHSCSCPDFQERNLPCKHVLATWIYLRREADGRPSVVTLTAEAKPTEQRDWSAYNAAQCDEKHRFAAMLKDLTATVEQPPYSGTGRPALPIADVLFALVYRVYERLSTRRFTSTMEDLARQGYLTGAFHWNSLLNYLSDPDMGPVFRGLIHASAQPFAGIETVFAADATGLYTRRFNHRELRYGASSEDRKRKSVKLHAMIGTTSNVVTDAFATEGNESDMNYFRPMLTSTAQRFNVQEVSADKGYSSKANVAAVEQVGAVPFIAFKNNTAAMFDGDTAWGRSGLHFALKREDFLARYHKRSNVETTFSMMKMKFGESLLSKSEPALLNEALCRVIAHNICCVNTAIHVLGLEPVFAQNGSTS